MKFIICADGTFLNLDFVRTISLDKQNKLIIFIMNKGVYRDFFDSIELAEEAHETLKKILLN